MGTVPSLGAERTGELPSILRSHFQHAHKWSGVAGVLPYKRSTPQGIKWKWPPPSWAPDFLASRQRAATTG